MSKSVWIGVVAGIVIAAGAYWWWSSQSTQTVPVDEGAATTVPTDVTTVPTPSPNMPDTSTTTTTALPSSVMYGDEGFSPKTVTISLGTSVEFTDRSTQKDMWVASAAHPTHQAYDGTTKDQHCATGYVGAKPFDQCSIGTSYIFTPDKTGTWKYHNHVSSGDFGTIIVQ